MPCNSDYLDPDGYEVALSRVACLLGELKGQKWTEAQWRGFHKSVYNKGLGKSDGDRMVRKLCDALRTHDVTLLSLEMQLWLRDHQEADKQRIEREAQQARAEKLRKDALAKLTPAEKRALGI